MKRLLMLAVLAAFAGSGCEIFRPRPKQRPRVYDDTPIYHPAAPSNPYNRGQGRGQGGPGTSLPQQMPERDPERIPPPGVPTNPSGEPPVVPQPAGPG